MTSPPSLRPSRAHRALLVPLALALASPAGAADRDGVEPLITDRPDFTESAATVAPGRFQIESGYTFTDSGAEETQTFGEVLVRIGLAERLELRVGLNSYVAIDTPAGDFSGFEDPSLGVKVRLAEGGGGRPETALLLGSTLPVGSRETGTDDAQPRGLLAFAWGLGDNLALSANLGAAYASNGTDRFTEWSQSLALGRTFSNRLAGFVEYFGITNSGGGTSDTHFVDAGLTRLLGPDLQVDFRVGTGLSSAADDFFVGAGFAWRR